MTPPDPSLRDHADAFFARIVAGLLTRGEHRFAYTSEEMCDRDRHVELAGALAIRLGVPVLVSVEPLCVEESGELSENVTLRTFAREER